jgi:hypothetical protein
VSLDFLFYSCIQSEKYLRAKAKGEIPIKWPELSNPVAKFETPEAGIKELLGWHRVNFEVLQEKVAVDASRVSAVAEAFVLLANDLDVLIEKMRAMFSSALTDSDNVVRALSAEVIPETAALFIKYWNWLHDTPGNLEEQTFEVGDRPPVGQYAPRFQRDRGPARDRGNQQRNSGGNGPRGGGQSRGGDQRRQGQQNGRGGGRNQDFRNQPNGPRKNIKVSEDQVREQVEAAILTMNNDGLDEYEFPSNNSYNRRLQHKIAVELGCETGSRGDEPKRFVVITRPKSDG